MAEKKVERPYVKTVPGLEPPDPQPVAPEGGPEDLLSALDPEGRQRVFERIKAEHVRMQREAIARRKVVVPYIVEVDYAVSLVKAFTRGKKRIASGYARKEFADLVFRPTAERQDAPTGKWLVGCVPLVFEEDLPASEVFGRLDEWRLLPALPQELVAYDRVWPHEPASLNMLLATGAETEACGKSVHACLFEAHSGRALDMVSFGDGPRKRLHAKVQRILGVFPLQRLGERR